MSVNKREKYWYPIDNVSKLINKWLEESFDKSESEIVVSDDSGLVLKVVTKPSIL